MRFEVLLERYFTNFPKILLLNLIFAVPSAVAVGAIYGLMRLIGENILLYLLPIVLLYPFYSGMVACCRNIARGDAVSRILPYYLSVVKEHFGGFLLHGVVAYVAAVLSYFAISLYIHILSVSWFFYVLLFICIIIVMFVLFMLFYVPLMTVTFELRLRYIYKNSFLMSFGELKNNLFALFGIAVVAAICFTVTIVFRTPISLAIAVGAMWALLIPATCTFVTVFFIYDGMYNIIVNKAQRKQNLEAAINNGGKMPEPKPADPLEDFSDIDVSTLRDTDDYIFHNGKMVKQSTILRLIREQQEREDKHE